MFPVEIARAARAARRAVLAACARRLELAWPSPRCSRWLPPPPSRSRVGWHTRIATAVSWALLVSLHARNPWLASMGGDALLRLFLFWGMFLPLGARLSLDARREPALARAPAQYVSAATVALLGQVCLVYFATGAQKSGELWRTERQCATRWTSTRS